MSVTENAKKDTFAQIEDILFPIRIPVHLEDMGKLERQRSNARQIVTKGSSVQVGLEKTTNRIVVDQIRFVAEVMRSRKTLVPVG